MFFHSKGTSFFFSLFPGHPFFLQSIALNSLCALSLLNLIIMHITAQRRGIFLFFVAIHASAIPSAWLFSLTIVCNALLFYKYNNSECRPSFVYDLRTMHVCTRQNVMSDRRPFTNKINNWNTKNTFWLFNQYFGRALSALIADLKSTNHFFLNILLLTDISLEMHINNYEF